MKFSHITASACLNCIKKYLAHTCKKIKENVNKSKQLPDEKPPALAKNLLIPPLEKIPPSRLPTTKFLCLPPGLNFPYNMIIIML